MASFPNFARISRDIKTINGTAKTITLAKYMVNLLVILYKCARFLGIKEAKYIKGRKGADREARSLKFIIDLAV
ncbi:MAG: hypothetical protein M0P14_01875, partial [Alkaliphilus sp.]|nr:hypothetical protein [Alkaliphilus sp.]